MKLKLKLKIIHQLWYVYCIIHEIQFMYARSTPTEKKKKPKRLLLIPNNRLRLSRSHYR